MEEQDRFLAAFDEHADALFRHCSFRIYDRERARDLVQDAFMKTWEYVAGGKKVENFRPFLYRTLHNLIIDEYRRKKTESLEEIVDEEWKEGQYEELVHDEQDALIARLDGAKLLEEVKRLPEKYRSVVLMRFVDGLEPQEIAAITNTSAGTVSVHLHRGLAKLKRELKEKYGDY